MGKPTLLLKALSFVYGKTRIRRGAGALVDAIPLRLLGGENIWVQTEGGNLLLRTRDTGARDMLLRKTISHEREEILAVRALLPEAVGFLDVGANYGWYTCLASTYMPASGITVAVEANPEVFRRLESTVASLPRVSAVHAAAMATQGIVPFYCAKGSNLSSAVRPVGAAVPVPGLPLDGIWPEGVPLDIVKCDVEGGELGCLEGARKLRKTWAPIWMLEFDEAILYEAGCDPGQLAEETKTMSCFYRSATGWVGLNSLHNILGMRRVVKNVFLVPDSRLSWFTSVVLEGKSQIRSPREEP